MTIPSPEILLGLILYSCLILYVLSAGADFGAGIWVLFAGSTRGEEQKHLIHSAMGPVWEANHVWLILCITILFTAFPSAYARMSIGLHIPLTLMLIGVVLRGAAFAFRTGDVRSTDLHAGYDIIFAVSSTLTAVIMGIIVGSLSWGHLSPRPDGPFLDQYVWTWLAPYTVTVGLWTLVCFMFLSATYLTLETTNPSLQNDFRLRALLAEGLFLVLTGMVWLTAKENYSDLTSHSVGMLRANVVPWILITATAPGTAVFLWIRRYRPARACAIVLTISMMWLWGQGQYPYVVQPDITLFTAAAEPAILYYVLLFLFMGGLILFPSLYVLFRTFKRHTFQEPFL